jgi:hypothetical protein
MTNEQDTPQVATGMFGVPLGSVGGALVPYASAGASPLAANPQSIFQPTIALPSGRSIPVEDQPGSPPTGQQQPEPNTAEGIAGERDRLLGLCRSLNRAGKCPGRCVFTGELRNSGISVFRDLTGDGT